MFLICPSELSRKYMKHPPGGGQSLHQLIWLWVVWIPNTIKPSQYIYIFIYNIYILRQSN